MVEENPKARLDLDFLPVQEGEKKFIFVRDHLGLVEGRLIPLSLFEFMIQMDGKKSLRELQSFLMRKMGGVLVSIEEVKRIVDQLDRMYLLDSERYRNAKQKIIREFSEKKIRPCSHCGKAYPKDPRELRKSIDQIVGEKEGSSEGDVFCIIAPHIDISVGSKVYGKVYKEIRGKRYKRVIILGVGHQMTEGLFCLTEKDFETPLGVVENDKEAVRRLKEVSKDLISKDDFAHKSEHSIEFQLIFLQHLLSSAFKIIPILCGSVKLEISEYTRSSYLERVKDFIRELSSIIQEEKETLIVAGMDLSHIGPKFGHDMPAIYLEEKAKRHDKALISAILKRSPDEFWEESKRVDDRFNVCGFSAIACVLEILPKEYKAELLDYQIWHERQTNSAVSFCGIKFLR